MFIVGTNKRRVHNFYLFSSHMIYLLTNLYYYHQDLIIDYRYTNREQTLPFPRQAEKASDRRDESVSVPASSQNELFLGLKTSEIVHIFKGAKT